MLPETVYDECVNALLPVLPEGWKQLLLYLEYGGNSYSFAYYVDMGDKGYIKCYDIPGISEETILKVFSEIDGIISQHRAEEGDWTNLTMHISESRKIYVDFDYTDLKDCAYWHQKNWKAKYLK